MGAGGGTERAATATSHAGYGRAIPRPAAGSSVEPDPSVRWLDPGTTANQSPRTGNRTSKPAASSPTSSDPLGQVAKDFNELKEKLAQAQEERKAAQVKADDLQHQLTKATAERKKIDDDLSSAEPTRDGRREGTARRAEKEDARRGEDPDFASAGREGEEGLQQIERRARCAGASARPGIAAAPGGRRFARTTPRKRARS